MSEITPELKALIDQRVEEGYIRFQTRGPLTIYNYTPAAQYERVWDEATMTCRGLILNGVEIVARSFKKFFNWGELSGDEQHRLSGLQFTFTEKMDGSLGILYYDSVDEAVRVATRGSFESEQAQWATQFFRDTYGDRFWPEGVTPLVEIIYPANRIVVDYGDFEGLVSLASINNATGDDAAPHLSPLPATRSGGASEWNFKTGEFKSYLPDDGNNEGYVIRFSDGTRVKIKLDEYVRLHRLVTQCTARSIWDLLRQGKSLKELLDRVPDEFYEWVQDKSGQLNADFYRIHSQAEWDFSSLPADRTRKEFAEQATKTDFPHLMFRLLDGKDITDIIWDMIRPEHELPFRSNDG